MFHGREWMDSISVIAAVDVVVDATYTTSAVHHVAMEPHAALVEKYLATRKETGK